jgi:branched-chain amino acid transport system substrate-binding protein
VSANPFQIPSSIPSSAFPPDSGEPSVDFAADPGAGVGPGTPIPGPPGPRPGGSGYQTPTEAVAGSNDPTQIRPASGPPGGYSGQGAGGYAAPGYAVPGYTVPGQTRPMPGQPGPGQQGPGQQGPGQQGPGQLGAGQQVPGQYIPGQQMPGQQMPGQQVPGQQVPGQQMPSQQVPGQQMPSQQVPGQQMPSQHVAGQQGPSQAFAGQQMPGQPFSAPPVSGQPYAAPPVSGQPYTMPAQPTSFGAPGMPTSGQPFAAPPLPGQPVSGIGQPAAGRPVFGAPGMPGAGGPPVPPQNPSTGWPGMSGGYPATPPPKKRGGVVAASVGAGALALVLIIVGVVWASGGFGGGGNPGPSPTGHGANGVVGSPACGYKIAFLGVLSGDNNGDGVMVRDSAKMAIDKYNADPKHANCGVTLSEFDTKQDSDVSATLAQQIVDDPKILGVVGPVYRNEMFAAAPVLDKASVSLITPSASDSELSRKGWKVFHRVLGTDADQADAGALYLQSTLNAKKVFIVADDSEFGNTGGTEARRKLGSAVVGSVSVGRYDKDFTAAAKQVTDSGADALYCACYWDDGAAIVKLVRTTKPTMIVMSGDRIFTQGFIDGAGKAQSEGVYMTCPCVPASQAGDNFGADYKAKYNKVANYYGPEAYDAANIYLAGLQSGASTRATMLSFVNAYSGRGVSRSIKFTVTGDLDVSSLDVWSYKVEGGYVVDDRVIPTS